MYQDLYYLLFNSITDALHQLEKNNIGMAEEILRNAQITAEEEYLQGGTDALLFFLSEISKSLFQKTVFLDCLPFP